MEVAPRYTLIDYTVDLVYTVDMVCTVDEVNILVIVDDEIKSQSIYEWQGNLLSCPEHLKKLSMIKEEYIQFENWYWKLYSCLYWNFAWNI